MKTIRIRAGKERALQRRHPWVFEGSVAGGKADGGETAERTFEPRGEFVIGGLPLGKAAEHVRGGLVDDLFDGDGWFWHGKQSRDLWSRKQK